MDQQQHPHFHHLEHQQHHAQHVSWQSSTSTRPADGAPSSAQVTPAVGHSKPTAAGVTQPAHTARSAAAWRQAPHLGPAQHPVQQHAHHQHSQHQHAHGRDWGFQELQQQLRAVAISGDGGNMAVPAGIHHGHQQQQAPVVALPSRELSALRSMLEQGLQLATCEAQLVSLGWGDSAAEDACSRATSSASEQASLIVLLDDDDGASLPPGLGVDVEAVMREELAAVQAQETRHAAPTAGAPGMRTTPRG